MRLRLGAALASALTISLGVITLFGLLISEELGLPSGLVGLLQGITGTLLQVVTITVALAILIGVLNLLAVHLGRLLGRRRGAVYSLVLILSFVLVLVTYVIDRPSSMILLETVQLSVESALAGLLLFALVYGAYRMMRHQVTGSRLLFVIVLLVVLVGAVPLAELERLQEARDWLLAVPVSAGARGILLGIALATVVTGVRVLVGVDRSYRE
jgi:hypothetical protein